MIESTQLPTGIVDTILSRANYFHELALRKQLRICLRLSLRPNSLHEISHRNRAWIRFVLSWTKL